MSMYTGKGDQGMTCLIGGPRIGKESYVLKVIGKLDKVESHLGKIKAYWVTSKNRSWLKFSRILTECQIKIKDMNTTIASNFEKNIFETNIGDIELIISEIAEILPELRDFIVPGSSVTESDHHLARVAVRSAERSLCKLKTKDYAISETHIQFLNRLSTLMFALGRLWTVWYDNEEEETRYHNHLENN